jgi:hypothetical protein
MWRQKFCLKKHASGEEHQHQHQHHSKELEEIVICWNAHTVRWNLSKNLPANRESSLGHENPPSQHNVFRPCNNEDHPGNMRAVFCYFTMAQFAFIMVVVLTPLVLHSQTSTDYRWNQPQLHSQKAAPKIEVGSDLSEGISQISKVQLIHVSSHTYHHNNSFWRAFGIHIRVHKYH